MASAGGPQGEGGGGGGCPAGSIDIDGACVPSCGAVGGNTCAGTGSTLCEGLALLESYDCEVCCARPPDPGPPGPLAFHIVDKQQVVLWDAIFTLWQQHPAVAIASQNKPDAVGVDRWVKNVHTSSAPTGAGIAAQVNALLAQGPAGPRVVMLDELNGETVAIAAEFASTMATKYPQWKGRWGAYTTVFTGGQPAIDELLQADAYIAVERYIDQKWYCAQGSNGGERDIALATFFDGNASLARFHWLTERKASLGSSSHLSVLFGVTDKFMNGEKPAVFLDRMFYVWVTRTKHPGAIAIANGGAGAWKWDTTAPGSIGVSNTSRDQAFAESVQWYSVDGKTDSRLGPVPCP